MSKQWIIYCALILQFVISSITFAAASGVPIICYHDVGGTVNNDYTVTKDTLKSHLSYLKTNGYHPISLEQYIAFTKDGAPLPDKPVMLTFDDGYISFYNDVFPLLKEYDYPAMLAIVGSWLDYAPPDVGKLVSWQQLREMDSSKLVSIASHSFRSHHFTPINSQDDRGELLSARTYSNGRYETAEEFKLRITDDLRQSQQQFEKELGHKVLAVVWPYGEYNLIGIDIAKSMGFETTFGLGGGINYAGNKGLVEARRGIIMNNPSTALFASFLQNGGLDNNPMKATYLDIDAIYDPTSLRTTDNNLTLAMARFNKNGSNTVFLQAVSDERNTGKSPEAYFHTTVVAVKADIFSHVANKLRDGGFLVYAVMPLSSQWLNPVELINLYSELGIYAYADGVLFQDNLGFNDNDKLQELAVELMTAVRTYRPYTLFARSIYPDPSLDMKGQDQYTQHYRSYLAMYDYTIIRANPLSEKQSIHPSQWLENVAQEALSGAGAAQKAVFQLNTFDVDKNVWIKDKELKGQIDTLNRKGAINFAYYPENTLEDKVTK